MTANDTKSYIPYINKLVDKYNNHSVNTKPIYADYSALSGKIETNTESPKFKVTDRARITKCKNILVKFTPKIGPEKC